MPATMEKTSVNSEAMNAADIRSIQLSDGDWYPIQRAEFVQFAVGQAHSPITPTKLYPALKYVSDGKTVVTPLSKITSFSEQ